MAAPARILTIQRQAGQGMEQELVVAVPHIYCRMLKGDASAAMFLAQVRYLQTERYHYDDGWFYRTSEEWVRELGFSDEVVTRCCKKLASFGLRTMVRAVNGIPKRHYHIDLDIMDAVISEFAGNDTSKQPEHFRESRIHISEKAGNAFPSLPEVILTETTTQITTETLDANASLVGAADADATTVDDDSQENDEVTKDSPDYKRAIYIRRQILTYHPKAKLPKEIPKLLAGWCRDVRLMRERDKRTPEEIKQVMDYVVKTAKWQKYVLSPGALRHWFDAIWLESNEKKGHVNGQSATRTASNRATRGNASVSDQQRDAYEAEQKRILADDLAAIRGAPPNN